MQYPKEYLSEAALQRAIRAQLVRDTGALNSHILVPLGIEESHDLGASANWATVLDVETAPAETVDAVRAAAEAVAKHYQLERRLTPRKE